MRIFFLLSFLVSLESFAHSENIYPSQELRGSAQPAGNQYSGGVIWFSGNYPVQPCPSASDDIRTIGSKELQQDYQETKFQKCEEWINEFRYLLYVSTADESGHCRVRAAFACGPEVGR